MTGKKLQVLLSIILSSSSITSSDKTFTFPDNSGTFGLLESDQIWSGLNKFQGSSNPTVYVGSSSLPGCIAVSDTNGTQVDYITVTNGVLSSSTTKLSNCQ